MSSKSRTPAAASPTPDTSSSSPKKSSSKSKPAVSTKTTKDVSKDDVKEKKSTPKEATTKKEEADEKAAPTNSTPPQIEADPPKSTSTTTAEKDTSNTEKKKSGNGSGGKEGSTTSKSKELTSKPSSKDKEEKAASKVDKPKVEKGKKKDSSEVDNEDDKPPAAPKDSSKKKGEKKPDNNDANNEEKLADAPVAKSTNDTATTEDRSKSSNPVSRKTSGAGIQSSKASSRTSSTAKNTREATEEPAETPKPTTTPITTTSDDSKSATKVSTGTSKTNSASSNQSKKSTTSKSTSDKKDTKKKSTLDEKSPRKGAGGKPPVASKPASTMNIIALKGDDVVTVGGGERGEVDEGKQSDAAASELASSAIEGALKAFGDSQKNATPTTTTQPPDSTSKFEKVPTLSISNDGGAANRSTSIGGSIGALIEVGLNSSHREISALALSNSKTTYVGPPRSSSTSSPLLSPPATTSKDSASEPTPETMGVPIVVTNSSNVRNPYTLASQKNKKTALEKMLVREDKIQTLIEKYEEDALRNKELWRERAMLARLQAAEKKILRERAHGRRAVDATNELESRQNRGGGGQPPIMWGAPVGGGGNKKNLHKKGDRNPAGGFFSSSEEDEGDFSHLTPEDAHSRMILKRARAADRRRRREDRERREAVLAARSMQMSQYVPTTIMEASRNPEGASYSPAHATTATTPLRERVLKELPLTREQERKLHHERRRQMREYAEATRVAEAALPKKPSKVQLPAIDKKTRSPSTLSNPAPQKLEAVRRGNDYMRGVAREQRERREKALAERAAKQDEDGELNTTTDAPKVPLTDVDVDAQLQDAARRKKMHDLGCGYLREQRDAYEKRKPTMAKREKTKQERQEEVDRAAQELKELRRIGHRLHATELYGRQGKKQPYSSVHHHNDNQPGGSGGTSNAEASSFSTTTVLPPIRRAVPATTADPEDILIKSAQAKIKMLQLLQAKNANLSASSTTITTNDLLQSASASQNPEL